jgi:6-pyruvoyltetrahydropterin/6-carboxytetrahydropterin synthase
MEQDTVWITKKFEFSASHRYWRDDWSPDKNEEVFGLCTSPHGHGHNYELHVTVSGKIDPDTGMIINLSELKKRVKEILNNFDHKFLNLDTPYFKDRIPTTENIGLVLFDQINRAFAGDKKFRVKKIRLYERHDLYVDIWGKDK